jgi:radical SAM superfamily enzyme YgiQ (UPF0313 family)
MLDILFVQNYYEQMLGIMQISSVLKQHGFSTDVSIGTEQQVLCDVVDKQPRVVGFYSTTGFHHKNLALAQRIKQLDGPPVVTIFGGPHPTFVPEMIHEEGVDIICRGEGEYAVLELIQALRDGTDYSGIRNLTIKLNGRITENPLRPLCDVDSLPHPDRELYKGIKHIYGAKRQEIMLGRGCPFSCNFCSADAYRELYRGIGSYVRLRSVRSAIDELLNVKERYQPSCFFFHDEIFACNAEYSKKFLAAYKEEINVPFSCLLRADLVSEEYVGLLKSAGCYLVAFGVESGNQQLRLAVLKKNISDEQLVSCAQLLHKYKIPFATFNMVGLPGEHLVNVWETVDLNIKIRPLWAWFSLYQTLPNTALAEYSLSHGYVQSVDVAPADANFHEDSLLLRKHPEGEIINRVKCCANIVVKFPAFKRIVKKFCTWVRLNALYGLIEKGMYFIYYYRKLTYNIGITGTIREALFILRHLKEFK